MIDISSSMHSLSVPITTLYASTAQRLWKMSVVLLRLYIARSIVHL